MLRYEVRDDVAWLTLDRASKLNALLPEFWQQLRDGLAAAGRDAARCVVISGEGRHFCAGGDIAGFGGLEDVGRRRAYQQDAMSALRALEVHPQPTIAAVQGYALGGGCEMTMVCDIVVADETATFGTPEASMGLMPGLGVVRGRAHVGLHHLKYMVFTGEQLSAQQALQAGLVNIVTPAGEHVCEAARLAQRVVAQAPIALEVAKRILNRGSEEGYDYSIEAVSLLHGTADQSEGIAAFTQRRPPRFEGR